MSSYVHFTDANGERIAINRELVREVRQVGDHVVIRFDQEHAVSVVGAFADVVAHLERS